MGNMKKVLCLVLVLVMVFGLVACAGGTAETANTGEAQTGNTAETGTVPAGADEKVVSIAMTSPWDTWNPYGSVSNYNHLIWDQIYDRLVVSNKDGSTEPRLAKSYEVAADSTSITFFLDERAKWSDGEPVTADDVVFTTELDCNPEFISASRQYASWLKGTDEVGVQVDGETLGVEKIDEHTVKFTYKQPMNEIEVLAMFNRFFFVIPKHVYEGYSAAQMNESQTWLDAGLIGSGPFVFDNYTDGVSVELKTNTEYYLGSPNFDRLIIKVVEGSQLLSNLLSGDVDAVAGAGIGSIPLADWSAAEASDMLETVSDGTFAYQVMLFNTQSSKISDPKVRQALSMAINRQSMVDNLLLGQATALQTGFLPYNPYYADDLDYPAYNPELAKQMLDEAGFDYSQTLELIVPTGNEIRIQSTVLIQQDLAAVGVNVNITQYDLQH